MSIISFLLKPKCRMSKNHTRPIKIGKFILSSHAQNRIAQKDRKITKIDVLDNLLTRPNGITVAKYDKDNRASYCRVGKRITTAINPKNNVVATIRHISIKEIKQFNLKKIENRVMRFKYVKQKTKRAF